VLDSMSANLISLFGGSLVTLGGLWLTSRLSETRERSKYFREKEAERILDLEERAGFALELAFEQKAGEDYAENFKDLMAQLRADAGKLRRYPELSKAARQLRHWCSCVAADRYRRADAREAEREAETALSKLLSVSKTLRSQ